MKSLSEAYRVVMGTRMQIETLEYDLQRARVNLANEESSLQDILSKTSFAYCTLDNPAITAELILTNSSKLTPEMRQQITTASQLYTSLT